MLGIINKMLIKTSFKNRIPNRIPAVMACTSSNAVDMIDVLPLPELPKVGGIQCMKEDNLYVI